MRLIGITGGAGSGKSLIMEYLSKRPETFVLYADCLAEELERPGNSCYEEIRKAFPDPALYLPDGSMDRAAFARQLFGDQEKLSILNSIVHPAVKQAILSDVEKKRSGGSVKLYFLEAALLIEDGYDKICDEIWFVRASAEVREKRLMETRGYSAEKVRRIMESQKSEEVFLCHADEVIENDTTPETAMLQIDRLLTKEEKLL